MQLQLQTADTYRAYTWGMTWRVMLSARQLFIHSLPLPRSWGHEPSLGLKPGMGNLSGGQDAV